MEGSEKPNERPCEVESQFLYHFEKYQATLAKLDELIDRLERHAVDHNPPRHSGYAQQQP